MLSSRIKQLTIKDDGIQKKFTISKLSCEQAIILLHKISLLLTDVDLIKSVGLQQSVHNIFGTGVQVEGINEEDYKRMMGLDDASLIALLVKSIITGLNGESIKVLIASCLQSVIYHNGEHDRPCYDAMQSGEIADWETIIGLIIEVLLLNYGGRINKLIKKYLPALNEIKQ